MTIVEGLFQHLVMKKLCLHSKIVLKIKERVVKLRMKNKNEAVSIKNNAHNALPPRASKPGQMRNLFKALKNENDKYSGSTMDYFGKKHMVFLERCGQAEIIEKERQKAFSIM